MVASGQGVLKTSHLRRNMKKFEFVDKMAAELAAIEYFKWRQLTPEAQKEYIAAAIRALAALEKMGIVITPPDD